MNIKPYVILVGIDFSELADRALVEALALASQHGNAEVHPLWVAPGANRDAFLRRAATRRFSPKRQ